MNANKTASKSTHTPGPWHGKGSIVVDGEGRIVLDAGFNPGGRTREAMLANRDLGAAAPELADALEKFVRQAVAGLHPRVEGDPVFDQAVSALRKSGRLP